MQLQGSTPGWGFFLLCCMGHAQSLSRIQLFVTPWTVACQAPLFPFQGIFLTQGPRDQTRVSCASCIGRRILCHLGHCMACKIKPVLLEVEVPSLNCWDSQGDPGRRVLVQECVSLGCLFPCGRLLLCLACRSHSAGPCVPVTVWRVAVQSELVSLCFTLLCFTDIHCSNCICSL